MNRKCTVPAGSSKRRRISDDSSDVSDDSSEKHVVGSEFVYDACSFSPLHLISEWTEAGTMTRRITVAMLLPSGVEQGMFSVSVVDGGRFVEMVVQWPNALVRMDVLHRKWLSTRLIGHRLEMYHPKIVGFERALKGFRRQASDNVESTCRIPLPFTVETHIAEQTNLAEKNSSVRIVYNDLKAAVDSYAAGSNSAAFEEF